MRSWEEHIQESYRKGSTLTSDHGRNTSKNHIGKAQHLYLTMGATHPRTMSEGLSTYIWPWEEHIQEPYQKGSTLISSHVGNTSRNHARRAQHLYPAMWGTHLASMLEGLNTYIWSCGNTSHSLLRMDLHLHMIMWEHIPQSHQNGYALTSDHVGTHTSITSEWICTNHVVTQPTITSKHLCTYIWPCEA